MGLVHGCAGLDQIIKCLKNLVDLTVTICWRPFLLNHSVANCSLACLDSLPIQRVPLACEGCAGGVLCKLQPFIATGIIIGAIVSAAKPLQSRVRHRVHYSLRITHGIACR